MHTPTPLRIGDSVLDDRRQLYWNPPDGSPSIAIALIHSTGEAGQAHADFIVRAVNSHAQLLGAAHLAHTALLEVEKVDGDDSFWRGPFGTGYRASTATRAAIQAAKETG